jgi:Cytochrome c oxidase subunit IV
VSDGVRTPPDHGPGRGVPDRLVPARVFAAVGVGLAAITLVYGVAASEEAGKALLTVTVAFLLWIAAYLWLRSRPGRDDAVEAEEAVAAEVYLPHASLWPFGIGVGAFMLANGLLIGGWFYLPGLAVTVFSLAGFIRQSRARS